MVAKEPAIHEAQGKVCHQKKGWSLKLNPLLSNGTCMEHKKTRVTKIQKAHNVQTVAIFVAS